MNRKSEFYLTVVQFHDSATEIETIIENYQSFELDLVGSCEIGKENPKDDITNFMLLKQISEVL